MPELRDLYQEIIRRGEEGTLAEIVIPLDRIDLGLPIVTVTPGGAAAMRTGRALGARDLAGTRAGSGGDPLLHEGRASVRVEDEEGKLLGVASTARDARGDEVFRPDVVLVA